MRECKREGVSAGAHVGERRWRRREPGQREVLDGALLQLVLHVLLPPPPPEATVRSRCGVAWGCLCVFEGRWVSVSSKDLWSR